MYFWWQLLPELSILIRSPGTTVASPPLELLHHGAPEPGPLVPRPAPNPWGHIERNWQKWPWKCFLFQLVQSSAQKQNIIRYGMRTEVLVKKAVAFWRLLGPLVRGALTWAATEGLADLTKGLQVCASVWEVQPQGRRCLKHRTQLTLELEQGH